MADGVDLSRFTNEEMIEDALDSFKDALDSFEDASRCRMALRLDMEEVNGIDVRHRLAVNQKIIEMIKAEICRRAEAAGEVGNG